MCGGRFTKGLAYVHPEVGTDAGHSAGSLLRTSTAASARATQRADTIGSLLGSVGSFVVWCVAVFMAFDEMGFALGPLLAGAGIVGVALGLGAQNLVRDFLAGAFLLIEDQYGVGDVIDAGPATGIVEDVSLRTTRLRDIEGNVWHIPNGIMERVANKSQEWSRALLDIQVSYNTPIDHAIDIIRMVVKTKPLSQWKVGREPAGPDQADLRHRRDRDSLPSAGDLAPRRRRAAGRRRPPALLQRRPPLTGHRLDTLLGPSLTT